MIQPKTYLSASSAAAYLGVSRSFLAHWRSAGYGPMYIKLGAGRNCILRYDQADLDTWMSSHKVQSTSEVPANV